MNRFVDRHNNKKPVVHDQYVFNGGEFFINEDGIPRLITAKNCTPDEEAGLEHAFAAEILVVQENQLPEEIEELRLKAQEEYNAMLETKEQILAREYSFVIKRTTGEIEVKKVKEDKDKENAEKGDSTEPVGEPQPEPQEIETSPPTQDATSSNESEEQQATNVVDQTQGAQEEGVGGTANA
ncbi:MAG: hypothetical protein R2688_06605 [Fimbriimonadaceae bacterium]